MNRCAMFRAQEIAPELAPSASSSFKAEESPAPEELQVMAFQWNFFTFMVDFHGFSISMLMYWRVFLLGYVHSRGLISVLCTSNSPKARQSLRPNCFFWSGKSKILYVHKHIFHNHWLYTSTIN